MSFLRDLKIAIRSLWHVPALWITVSLTLALGIAVDAVSCELTANIGLEHGADAVLVAGDAGAVEIL
jgi:hypothetical protein